METTRLYGACPCVILQFMMPNVGVLDPTFAKALILDTGVERLFIVTIDAIGSDSTIRRMVLDRAQARGVNITDRTFMLSGSHSHSGTTRHVAASVCWRPHTQAPARSPRISFGQWPPRQTCLFLVRNCVLSL